MGFNRSVRGEMNLRAFEVPANGALLLMERENLEVREFFEPGHEVVLYGEEDFEDIVHYYASHESERIRIARSGHARVRQYRMSRRLPELLRTALTPIPAGRSRPASRFDLALGRAHAIFPAITLNRHALADARIALEERPDDPRPWNAVAVAALASELVDANAHALAWFQRALRLSPGYAPAIANLARLFSGTDAGCQLRDAAIARFSDPTTPLEDLDGAQLPTAFDELHRLQIDALRHHFLVARPRGHSLPRPAAPDRSANRLEPVATLS